MLTALSGTPAIGAISRLALVTARSSSIRLGWSRALSGAAGVIIILGVGASAQSSNDLAKRKRDNWVRCLNEAYQINRKRTPDRNLAAEIAFQSCSTKEEEFWADSLQMGIPRSLVDGLKSAIKQDLMAD